MTTRALPMNSSVPPMASLVFIGVRRPTGTCRRRSCAVTLAPMWKCTGRWRSAHASQNGSHAAVGQVGRAEVLRVGRHVHAAGAERGDALGLGDAARRRSTPASAAAAGAGCPSRPGSRPCGRCRARSPALQSASSSTMPRSWPPRPIVLGKMTCASMPHSSSTCEAHLRVVRPDVDRPRCPSRRARWSALSFDRPRPITPPALARPSGWPSNTHVGLPSIVSTCGTRSLYFSGASFGEEVGRSVKWESASMTRVPSLSMCPAYRRIWAAYNFCARCQNRPHATWRRACRAGSAPASWGRACAATCSRRVTR